MSKTVALFGGSFNPPHEGHLGMASYIHRVLDVDETWMLFSKSPDKDSQKYASLEDRMAMARILAKHYPEPIIMSDLEAEIAEKLGRYETFYILEEIQKRYPDDKFIWVMGADSFSKFHEWLERDDILESFIVAVVDRPGYTETALNSPTAHAFAETRIDLTHPFDLKYATRGWCFLGSPHIPVSSTAIMDKLQRGETDFHGPFAEVVDYIRENGLYDTSRFTTKEIPLQRAPT